MVGENGVKLLVLDEATSALDAETERIITETLDSLAGDVTSIVIAHRLATVRHCDQVIHLAAGGLLGEGLLRKSERRCQSSIGRRSCSGFSIQGKPRLIWQNEFAKSNLSSSRNGWVSLDPDQNL